MSTTAAVQIWRDDAAAQTTIAPLAFLDKYLLFDIYVTASFKPETVLLKR